MSVHHRIMSLDFPLASHSEFCPERTRDLPVLVRSVSVRALGSQTSQDPGAPCDDGAPGVAFRIYAERRHPEAKKIFRGSIPSPYVPLSTLRRRPYGRLRMTRGRCRSLVLHRLTLSFSTLRRFIPGARIEFYARLFSIRAGWRALAEKFRDLQRGTGKIFVRGAGRPVTGGWPQGTLPFATSADDRDCTQDRGAQYAGS